MLHLSYVEGERERKTQQQWQGIYPKNAVPHVSILLHVKLVQQPFLHCRVCPFFFVHSVPALPILCEVICHCV